MNICIHIIVDDKKLYLTLCIFTLTNDFYSSAKYKLNFNYPAYRYI